MSPKNISCIWDNEYIQDPLFFLKEKDSWDVS